MKLQPAIQIHPDTGIAHNSPAIGERLNQDILTAAKGGGVSFAGRLFEYLVRFVFGIMIARAIGVEQFGLYTLSITVALIASNAAMLGLHTGMVRFLPPAIRDKNDRASWGIIQVSCGLPFLISLGLSVVLFLFSAPLSNFVFDDARLNSLLKLVSVLIPIDTLGFMAYTVTISFKKPQYSALANNVVIPLAKLFLAAVFLAIGLSTLGVLAATVIASFLGLGVLIYYVNSLFPLKRPFGDANRSSSQLLRYSFPVYLGWMVNTVRISLSTLMLGFLGLTSGVGVFAAASRFSAIGSMFFLAIGNISTPIIADLHSQGGSIQIKAFYQTTTRWMVMFNLPVFLTSLLFAKPMLSIFGDDFTAGATSMMILAVGTLVYTITGIGANILDMSDHPKVNTTNSVLLFFLTIALNLLLVPQGGVVGASIATSVSVVLVNVVCLIEVWVLLGMQPYNRSFFKPVVAGLAAALAAFLLNRSLDLPFLLQLIIGGGALWSIYAFALFILKLAPEDKALLERLLSRFRRKLPAAQDLV